jgi:N-acetylglucosamine-6-sulfatase
VIALVAGLTSGFGLWGSSGATRPNLVLIVTDDERWDSLGTMPEVRSLLADHGVTFKNMFVTTSLCCPSRASILTGQYSHHTGVLDGSTGGAPGGAPAFHDRSTIATWLHDAGYTTGLVGKYLNDYAALPTGYIPPGWDTWDAIAQARHEDKYYGYELNENGTIVKYGNAPSDYTTTVLQNKATAFIDRARSPFFLYFAPVAPHLPAIPAPGDAGALADLPPFHPPSFLEADVSDKPQAAFLPPVSRSLAEPALSDRRHMLQSLLAVDRAVAAIVHEVETKEELSNTYFLFTSDNGFLWGEHRLIGKIWPYEESIRVPLVVRVPGSRTPRTDSDMVLNIDLASTLAELAGVAPGLPQDGRSLVPLLRGKDPPWRSSFVEEFLGDAPRQPRFVALRTTRYVYVEYRNGWRELYDLRTDRWELRNIAREPGTAALRSRLSSQLHASFARPPG